MVEIIKAVKKINAKMDEDDTLRPDKPGNSNVNISSSGWISPQYSRSRRIQLDTRILAANRLTGLLPDAPENTYYKVLRTQIQQRMQINGWNTLMVTSVHPREGKTVTAINLAGMFAREFDKTVLLVDADLRYQAIHKYLGYDSDRGLVDYLLGNEVLADIIAWPEVEKFTVISGGAVFQEGSEILNSPRMRKLVEEVKHRYHDRYVFYDVPPVLGSTDAMVFANFVDAIVLVIQDGKTLMPDIQKALAYLPKEKFLGFIMSGHS